MKNRRRTCAKSLMLRASHALLKKRKAQTQVEAGSGEAAPVPMATEGGDETPLAEDGDETPIAEAGGGEAAPATPEPVAEVPWPAAGVKVAVGVEHLMHALRLGERRQ